MKYLILILLFPTFIYSQDSSRLLSKYEKFSTSTGVMYKTETKEISKIKDITVSFVKTTDLGTSRSVSAIQIFQKNTFIFTPISLGVLYIDIDELDGVSKALKYYLEQIKKGKPQNEPSFNYVTSNDVQVSCIYAEGSFGGWFVSLSQRYHYSKSTISGTAITIKSKDIDDLAEAIVNAKTTTL